MEILDIPSNSFEEANFEEKDDEMVSIQRDKTSTVFQKKLETFLHQHSNAHKTIETERSDIPIGMVPPWLEHLITPHPYPHMPEEDENNYQTSAESSQRQEEKQCLQDLANERSRVIYEEEGKIADVRIELPDGGYIEGNTNSSE